MLGLATAVCLASCSTGAVFVSILVHFLKDQSVYSLRRRRAGSWCHSRIHEAGLWNHFQEIAFDMSAVSQLTRCLAH